MEKKCGGDEGKWKHMQFDILLKIFMSLNVMELIIVSRVCTSWRQVCQHPLFWETKTLDLNNITDEKEIHQNSPFRTVDFYARTSIVRLSHYMKRALNLSNGNLRCLVYSSVLPINSHILLSAAERSPGLKRLVLPAWRMKFSKDGIIRAMKLWKELESLTIIDNEVSHSIVEAIGKYCNNFSELKVTHDFGVQFAKVLVKHVPKLKVLSLQSAMVSQNAIVEAVGNLRELEVLNISHTEMDHNKHPRDMPMIMEVVSRVPKLIMCEGKGKCNLCPNVKFNMECCNCMAWKKCHENQFWKEDAISSFRF